MEIFDWKPVNVYGRGKFALEFEVTKFDEDNIRYMINNAVIEIQKKLRDERKDAD